MYALKMSTNNKEKIIENQPSLKKKLAKAIKEGDSWFDDLTDNEAAKVGWAVYKSGMDNQEIEIEVISNDFSSDKTSRTLSSDNANFDYYPVTKYIYILYKALNRLDSERNVSNVFTALKLIEPLEKKFGKPVYLFDSEETEMAVKNLYTNKEIFGLKFKIQIYKEITDFYKSEFPVELRKNEWEKIYPLSALQNILNQKFEQRNITKNDLLNLFDTMANPQQGIIPLLIFEGLLYSTKYEPDELRGLREENVLEKQIFVSAVTKDKDKRGFRLKIDRVIDIDDETHKRLNVAKEAASMIIMGRGGLTTVMLSKSDYIIRSMSTRPKATEGHWVSFGGVGVRMEECRAVLEKMNPLINDFRATYIANCGKSHYVYKYIEEGLTETAAIIKVLKRFGEWNSNGDERQEVVLDTNKIRMARLRKAYPIFRGTPF